MCLQPVLLVLVQHLANSEVISIQNTEYRIFIVYEFVMSNCNLKSFGQHSFSFLAPPIWNSLPASLGNLPIQPEFNTQLTAFLLQFIVVCFLVRSFHKSGETLPVSTGRVHVFVPIVLSVSLCKVHDVNLVAEQKLSALVLSFCSAKHHCV